MMNKQFLAFLTAVLLLLAFAACGGDDENSNSSSSGGNGGGNSSSSGGSGGGSPILAFTGADFNGQNGADVPNAVSTYETDRASAKFSTANPHGGSACLNLVSLTPGGLIANVAAYKSPTMADAQGRTSLTFWWRGTSTVNPAGIKIQVGDPGNGSAGPGNFFLDINDFSQASYAASVWRTENTAPGNSYNNAAAHMNIANWTKVSVGLPAGFSPGSSSFQFRLGRNANASPTAWDVYLDDVMYE